MVVGRDVREQRAAELDVEIIDQTAARRRRLLILRKGASLRLLVARRTESNLPTDCGGEA
jgi:hypothetical protein